MNKIILLSFIIFILARIINFNCDLPVQRTEILQNIGEFYYDEGWWSLGARDLYLFGDPEHSHFNPIPVTPVATAFYLGFFKCFGVNLISLRLTGVVASLISLLLFLSIMKGCDDKQRILAFILFGSNSLFLLYSRSGLLEVICLPFLLGSMLLYLREQNFLAGLLAGTAVLVKPHAIFFLFLFLFMPRRLKTLLGFLIIVVPWAILIQKSSVLVHYQSSRWLTSGSLLINLPKSLLLGLVYRDTFFRNNPLFFIFALLSLPGLYNVRNERTRFFFLWAVTGGIFFGVFPFQVARYLILLLPPLVYALAEGKDHHNRFLGFLVVAIIVSQTAFGLSRPFIDNYHGPLDFFPKEYQLSVEIPRFLKTLDLSIYPDFFARMILYVLAAGGSLLLGIFIGLLRWRTGPVRTIIPLIIIFDLFLNAWILFPRYSFIDLGRRLSEDVTTRIGPAGTFSLLNNLDYENLPVLRRDMDNPELYPGFALLISYHPLMGHFNSSRFLSQFRAVKVYQIFDNRYEVTLYEKITHPPCRTGEHLTD